MSKRRLNLPKPAPVSRSPKPMAEPLSQASPPIVAVPSPDAERVLARLHGELRRQIADRDQHGDDAEGLDDGVVSLIDVVRLGGRLGVGNLARTCRALGWDLASFYVALGLQRGDYPGLMRLNGGVYVDIEPTLWTVSWG